MIRRMMVILLALTLLLGAMPGAQALSSEEKYQAAHDELLRYLGGGSLMSADDLFLAFSSCNHSYSASFVLYTKILADVEKGDFSLVFPLLQNLRVNVDFCRYVAETEGFGSVDELEAYAEGRQQELAGNVNGAMAAYSRCMSFQDAAQRYYNLSGAQLEQQYQDALWYYGLGTNDGFIQAREIFRTLAELRYKDSEHYLMLCDLLCVTPTPRPTATPTPRPTATPTPRPTATPTPRPTPRTVVIQSTVSTGYSTSGSVTRVRVKSGGASLRSSARVGSYNKIASIREGTYLDVQSESDGWYRVSYNGEMGYVSSSKVDVVGRGSSTVMRVRTGKDGASFRSQPDRDPKYKVASIHEGVELQVDGELGEWYRVYYKGQWGYVSKAKVEIVR